MIQASVPVAPDRERTILVRPWVAFGIEKEPSVRAMMQNDRASAGLGLVVDIDQPGYAVVSMTVRDDMLNGFAITHGGMVFALADTAFALGCNEDDFVTVAAGADISFIRATRAGQRLTATARRRVRSGRSGVYDVTVVDETGEIVAEFRGRSRTTTKTLAEAGVLPDTE